MKMRLPKINKYVGTLLGAVVLGVLAVLLTMHYLHQQKSQYQQELQSKLSRGMAQVVVPRKNLPKGAVVNGSNMAQRLFPRDLLYPDTVTTKKWSRYAGRALRRPVQAGKPLLGADFNAEAISEFAALLQHNHRAVTISVDDINSISGMIQPGDRIDVMMMESGNKKTSLLPLLTYVRVLATGVKIFNPAEGDGMPSKPKPGASLADQYSTLTLELTPQQASELMVARQIGDLKIALSPRKINPGAPTMPMETGKELVDKLSGKDKRPHMRGYGGIQFIIGSTQGGVTSHRNYAGLAPVKPTRTKQHEQAQSRASLQRKATQALTNLINANSPGQSQAQMQSGQAQ
jgi:pilus assembly protein CpaB